jgi:hypothetical protein
MEIRDLVVTPLVILVVYALAYGLRKRLTDKTTAKYYFPALTLKICGALALGFLYQYYYKGGDTYNYHTHGSRIIWQAFMDSPVTGWNLLTSGGQYMPGTYQYASRILFYTDPPSFFVVQVAALFDLLTFSSYAGTAVCFAFLSFFGSWLLFLTFYRLLPHAHAWVAVAVLFVPSVLMWGSGILKDTLTLSALGMLTYAVHGLFVARRFKPGKVVLLAAGLWILFSVKKYVLMCFLPALLLWVYANRLAQIRSVVAKILIVPFIILLLAGSGYYAVILIGKDDPRYAPERLAVTAQITAYDIGFYTGKDAGSTYSLGKLDGTFANLLSKFPQAVNVSLFRPYLWEVRNPLMLLSALESLVFLVLTLVVLVRHGRYAIQSLGNPIVLFCLVFSVVFAFAVGVSTFNFGTLSRYKIPLIPFYLMALIVISQSSKSERNKAAFD